MSYQKFFAPALVAVLSVALFVRTSASADESKKPAGQLEMKLPPGWTEEDMKACMLAGTPGKEHQHLASGAGTWTGKVSTWMAPGGGEPMKSECTSTVTALMDGRYITVDVKGDMPGMGPFKGFGLYGFDNVSRKYVASWVDNMGTGMMTGTGELSADGKTLTWANSYNCPITKKPSPIREIETITGPDTKTLEMFGNDPKTGKEFQMMKIEFTKK